MVEHAHSSIASGRAQIDDAVAAGALELKGGGGGEEGGGGKGGREKAGRTRRGPHTSKGTTVRPTPHKLSTMRESS